MEYLEFVQKYQLKTPILNNPSKIQGWQSESPALLHALKHFEPKTVAEIGTWLGASVIFMCENSEAEILAVDTFLASNEVLWREQNAKSLVQNFSNIFDQFCSNITSKDFNSRVSVLPMTSSSAAELCKSENLSFDLVYLDAGHRFREVYNDLTDWWPLTKKGLIGDDYSNRWPEVKDAAQSFANEQGLQLERVDTHFILSR